jgi:hypothetical protein
VRGGVCLGRILFAATLQIPFSLPHSFVVFLGMFAFVIKSFSRIIPKSVPNQNISMKHYKNDFEFVIHKTLIKKIQYVFKGEKGEVSTIWI